MTFHDTAQGERAARVSYTLSDNLNLTEHQRREIESALCDMVGDEPMIEQFCRDLNAAHDEILALQGCHGEDAKRYDWPVWSGPANSIRWAEKLTGKPLSKTSLRTALEVDLATR